MKFARRTAGDAEPFDMTPLIDMVFLLLIFFLLTSNYVYQPGIRVHLPKAMTSQILESSNLIIIVTQDNLLYVEGRVVDWEQLSPWLQKAHRDNRAVVIKADRQARMDAVVRVWDLCREMGISQLSVATTR